MTVFTKTAVDIFAAQDASGAARKVANHDVQVWGTEVERLLKSFIAGGGVVFTSKAEADANLNYAANTMAWVLGDPVAGNNGVYQKDGASGSGSWQRLDDLPYSFILATNSGGGTADAIQATTVIPVPAAGGGALIALPIVADNTASPVTVSFNGATPLTIKTASGSDIAPGGLTQNMIVWGYKQGANFRLATDQASAAIQAAAEDAADRAEAAAVGLEHSMVFSTKALAEAFSPATAPDFIRIAGYAAAGDGGGALYKKVAAEPTHAGKLSITLSDTVTVVWYEIAETVLRPEMFGAQVGAAATDNYAAILNLFDVHDATGVPVDLGDDTKVYEVSDKLYYLWTRSPVIYGSGARFKLVRGVGEEVDFAVHFQVENLGFNLRGWGVDAQDMAYNGIWIENTAASYVDASAKDFYGEDLFATNVRRAGQEFSGGRGISVRGAFRNATLVRPRVVGVKLAAGAGIVGTVGVTGIYVGRGVGADDCPMHTLISEPYVENVYSEDPDYQYDQDGLLLFATIPTGNAGRSKQTWRVDRPTFKNCWGRGIKAQAQNVVVESPTFERNAGFWTGNKGLCEIDFQWGEGTVRDITCVYAGGWAANVVVTTARDYAAGAVLVDGLEVVGTVTFPSVESLVFRWSDASHLPCKVTLKNATTLFCQVEQAARYYSRVSSSTTSHRRDHLVVEDVSLNPAPTEALVLLGGTGQTTTIMASKNTHVSSGTVPLVSEDGATANVIQIGGVGINPGFT